MAPPVTVGGAPLAHAADRFVAYLIDSLISSVLLLIPLGVMLWAMFDRIRDAFDAFPTTPAPNTDPFTLMAPVLHIELLFLAVIVPLSLIESYFYYVTFMHRTGQTPGKRVMKIKVVRLEDGSPIDARIARRRWLAQSLMPFLSAWLPGFVYADLLWLLWDVPYRQCLHDKVALTAVVKVTAAGEG
ncbi:MAG TPA: RDD family protein [Micromonosporaceae bacterium]|nr:RDD family protein [Micromonosporaceae bacterium]